MRVTIYCIVGKMYIFFSVYYPNYVTDTNIFPFKISQHFLLIIIYGSRCFSIIQLKVVNASYLRPENNTIRFSIKYSTKNITLRFYSMLNEIIIFLNFLGN